MPEVVGEPRHLDDVRVAAEGVTEFPRDLGDLEGVREPGAREVRLPATITWVLAASRRSADECSTRAIARTRCAPTP